MLTHELVHDERGGGASFPGQPATWEAVVRREELRVDAEVARRLVPADELRARCAALGSVDDADVAELADHFDVPEAVLRVALRALADSSLVGPP